jgi:hypothetical protein
MKKPEQSHQGRKPAARKPYQKPAFEREQLFETMALACGKTLSGHGIACHNHPKNS